MKSLKNAFLLGFICCVPNLFSQQTVSLTPVSNNTLYEDASGSIANGQGQYIFAGVTNVGTRRRAVLRFDISGSIPSNATITGATLSLTMNQTIVGATPVGIYLVTNSWGEGASMASGMEGGGAQAQTNDATWLHRFFSGTFWGSAGGDFNPTPLATQSVSGNGTYTWTSAGLINQVQQWLTNPTGNHGIIVVGDESTQPTAKRFHSRHSGSISERPQLSVTYTVPCINPSVPTLQLLNGPFCSGDSAVVSITGNLNSATHWQVYSGSCGGALVGQTNGTTFSEEVVQSTTWFIRGEGGCVSPGACAQISISVTQNDDPAFSYSAPSYCSGDGTIAPVVNGTGGGTFSVSPGGPSVQPSTGAFLAADASPGSPFVITYTTPGPQCPASAIQTLTVWPVDTVSLSQTICPGDSVAFNGQFISQPGTYTAHLTSSQLCDSVVNMTLSWFPQQSADFSYSAATYCTNAGAIVPQVTGTQGGFFSAQPAGSYLNVSSGAIQTDLAPIGQTLQITYTSPGPNCAVSSQQSVTVFPVDTMNLSQTICPGDSILFGGQYLQQAGTYSHLETSSNGCDSLVVLNLAVSNVDPSFSYSVSQVCINDTIQVPVVTGTPGGVFSVVPATVALNPQTGSFQPSQAQAAQTYQITYTTPGANCPVSSDQFIHVNGVDTLHMSQAICPGDSAFFDGQWFVVPGVYTSLQQSSLGCDSLVIFNLNGIPLEDASFSYSQDSICLGGALLVPQVTGVSGGQFSVLPALTGFDGQSGSFPASQAQAGALYTVTYQTPGITCQNQEQRNIFVLPADTVHLSATLCSGDSLFFANEWLFTSGAYSDTLLNGNGCDSVIFLQLTLLPVENASFAYAVDSVCYGAGGLVPQILGTSGGVFSQNPAGIALDSNTGVFDPALATPGTVYQIRYQTPGINGCADSLSAFIWVLETDTAQVNLEVCAGDSVLLNGQYFLVSGNFVQQLSNVNGCDSVLQISVAIVSVNAGFTVNGDTLTASLPTGSYQWYTCAENGDLLPIANAQQVTYLVESTGEYALILNSGGCSDTSACVQVVYSSIEMENAATFGVYPNPSSGRVWVSYPSSGRILVVDALGRVVKEVGYLGGVEEVSVGELSSGVYFVIHSSGVSSRLILLKE